MEHNKENYSCVKQNILRSMNIRICNGEKTLDENRKIDEGNFQG
jgi:hypothetical protein